MYLSCCESVDWIHPSCDGSQWWTVVNMILKCHVSWNFGEYLAHLGGCNTFKDCAILS
jgi:hypothetical protein